MTEHWQTTDKAAAGTLRVGFAWLDPEGSADLALPAYATALAAGMDVAACTSSNACARRSTPRAPRCPSMRPST